MIESEHDLHSVEKVSKCLIILFLRVVDTTMNVKWEGLFETSNCHCLTVCLIVSHLHQGLHVRVAVGHEVSFLGIFIIPCPDPLAGFSAVLQQIFTI